MPIILADIDAMGDDFDEYEVLDGELVDREWAGEVEGRIGFQIGIAIGSWVKPRDLGHLYSSATAFVLGHDPLQILKPDVSFIAAHRSPVGPDDKEYVLAVPDLVVEVRSPRDLENRVQRKVERYLAAGVRLVWLVEPPLLAVTVSTPGAAPYVVGSNGELGGGGVLPGLRVRLAEVFASWAEPVVSV